MEDKTVDYSCAGYVLSPFLKRQPPSDLLLLSFRLFNGLQPIGHIHYVSWLNLSLVFTLPGSASVLVSFTIPHNAFFPQALCNRHHPKDDQ